MKQEPGESESTSFVVAVSSVAGGGKTTLVTKAGQLLGATTLFFDDYRAVSQYPQDLRQWVEDGADLSEWKTPQLAKDLSALKRGESIQPPVGGATISSTAFIIIEEPMGRGRDEMAKSIDFVALIETPPDIALARRFLRMADANPVADLEQTTRKQLTESVEALAGFLRFGGAALLEIDQLRSYLDVSRSVYMAVQEQVAADCDLVLDGRLPADELAEQLVGAVRRAAPGSARPA